ncbi:Oidioi.mRNA.OKI2018_I69.XSR.g15396.t1.cds [Oikopleura dioica]|uniref:Oidioi.mRNA.OKI2018_I69.XSR.g15396.t1.cds n=1 Tax=Oikopleura dioica TaxID=34765 RepID=A0ABN7SHW3_OIKDI|nr:Oidioi.mRNA.OKI2018_I69.XSR.g15396.t1.cds [Oikopleura dioica]
MRKFLALLVAIDAFNDEILGNKDDILNDDINLNRNCYVKLPKQYNTNIYQPFSSLKNIDIRWSLKCENNDVLTFCGDISINLRESKEKYVPFDIRDVQRLTKKEEFTVDSSSCYSAEAVKNKSLTTDSGLLLNLKTTTISYTQNERASFGISIVIQREKSAEKDFLEKLSSLIQKTTNDGSARVTLLGNQSAALESHRTLGFEVDVRAEPLCPTQIPFFDLSFLAGDQCWRQRDINKTILAELDNDGKVAIHGKYSSAVSSFVIISVAQGILLAATLIFTILIFKRRPYDHQFYKAEKSIYGFSLFVAFMRFLISTMICYQYPKNSFVNTEAVILFFIFVYIDLLIYILHFLNLLRRVWSNNIIGGHYYLPLRYFGHSLQTLLSTIPKHCVVYIYYCRTLPVSGYIPVGIMLLIWTELILIPMILVIQSLDLRFHLPDLQKDNTKIFSSFVIINYLQSASQLFVNLSLLGATYLRQIIVSFYADAEFTDLKPPESYSNDSIAGSSPINLENLPGLQAFAPRLGSCTSLSKFKFNGMGIKNCFNNLETIILAIALVSLVLSGSTSIYFGWYSRKTFRDISKNFRELYDRTEDRLPIRNYNADSYGRRGMEIPGHSRTVSSDRMTFQ